MPQNTMKCSIFDEFYPKNFSFEPMEEQKFQELLGNSINQIESDFMIYPKKYKILKELGRGSYSRVYKIQTYDVVPEKFALKAISKQPFSDIQLREQLMNEIRIQRSMECEEEHLETRQNEEKGSKNRKDLKPENILLSFDDDTQNPDAFLADFGFAIELKDGVNVENIFGTPGYVAPEVLKGEDYTFKSDIFSVGSILYNVITGSGLFKGKTAKEALFDNMKQKLLSDSPKNRPTASEALNHPWFSDELDAINYSLNVNSQDNSKNRNSSLSPFSGNSAVRFPQSPMTIKNTSNNERKFSQFRQHNQYSGFAEFEQNKKFDQRRGSDYQSSQKSRRMTFNQIMQDYNTLSKNLGCQDSPLKCLANERNAINRNSIDYDAIKGQQTFNAIMDNPREKLEVPSPSKFKKQGLLSKSGSANSPKQSSRRAKRSVNQSARGITQQTPKIFNENKIQEELKNKADVFDFKDQESERIELFDPEDFEEIVQISSQRINRKDLTNYSNYVMIKPINLLNERNVHQERRIFIQQS
ncbi:serine threonine protein kinase [Stylonychia lemnae]|uniref:Serine threonine protein kinase n=1 Tax=Stylonychia lemnae TaxID=5949 RepID=A0A078ANB8_STYLE|nr:serine threonine protein kinase [Stylonychia lemnae]|eukprot:CDW82433.1 serine threonine protein kinase [Stylonychia lemnae]